MPPLDLINRVLEDPNATVTDLCIASLRGALFRYTMEPATTTVSELSGLVGRAAELTSATAGGVEGDELLQKFVEETPSWWSGASEPATPPDPPPTQPSRPRVGKKSRK